jgi:hypothetical protein
MGVEIGRLTENKKQLSQRHPKRSSCSKLFGAFEEKELHGLVLT